MFYSSELYTQKAPKGAFCYQPPRWSEFRTTNWAELFDFPEVSMLQIQALLESNTAN
jgi:hypothetical protein